MANNVELKNVIVAFVKDCVKANALGVQIVGHFPIDNLKKGTAKNRTEAYNRFYNAETNTWNVSKVTTFKNVTLQRNYVNSCENRSDNMLPYNAEKPNGKSWVSDAEGILLVSDTDDTKFYLRLSQNKNTVIETTYYIGEREATAEEVAIIKEFSPQKNYVCKKQLEYGISEENQVLVRDFTLTNIVSIKFGEKFIKLR